MSVDLASAEFLQVTRRPVDDWLALSLESPAAMRIWLVLVRRADRGNRVVISDLDLMMSAVVSRRTFYYAIKLLVRLKFIEQTDTVYDLNAQLVWRGPRAAIANARLSCPLPAPNSVKRNSKPKQKVG